MTEISNIDSKRKRGLGRKAAAREKLLAAALNVIRQNGYAGTSVDALCAEAGVTKGAFFHHFKSKADLAVAAAAHWSEITGALFRSGGYHDHADPLDRIFGYLDFRRALLEGAPADFSCLVGTMVQESFASNPAIRDACAESIFGHARTLEADFAAAIEAAGLGGEIDARSLARHTQAVLQGGFILAKASDGAEAAADAIDHLERYLKLLFVETPKRAEAARLPAMSAS